MRKNFPVSGVEKEFKSSANILSTTDLKGRITYINPDFIDVSGFTEDELIHQNHHIVRHPDMPPSVFKMFWADLTTDRSWMGIVKNRCKNGDHYWVDAYATPIKHNSKTIEYQSVRRKARPEFIERAEKIYQSINNGKSIEKWTNATSLKFKLVTSITIPFTLLLAVMLINASLPIMLACLFISVTASLTSVLFSLHPVENALKETYKVSNDKVARYIYTGRSDEAGSILLAIKKLESENAALIGRINDLSGKLNDSTNDLSSAVSQSHIGTIRQVEQTERVATAIAQMSDSIQHVAQNARESSVASTSTLAAAKQGQAAVLANTDAIKTLKTQINLANNVINEVSNQSESIQQIVNVITGIADQTNLLALNAAIEAARAGSSGRGFAVVADEVRSLANRTQESTEQIRDVIETLQVSVQSAVEAMEAGEVMAQDSVNTSLETAKSLEQIFVAINTISIKSDEIAQSVEEQSAAASSIGHSLASIKSDAEQNLDAVNLSNEVSEKTIGISRQLDQLTSNFWFSQQGL